MASNGCVSTGRVRRLGGTIVVSLVFMPFQSPNKQFTLSIEWSWHRIFGQPWAMSEPEAFKICPGGTGNPHHHVCGHGGM